MAVRFSASGQHYSRNLNLGTVTQFSFSLWLKITTDRNSYSGALTLNGDLGSYVLQTDSDGTTLFLIDGAENARGSRSLTVGTWYFVGVSLNGTNGTMVTRSLADTAFTTTTWTSSSANFEAESIKLGETQFTGEFWNGCLAAVKLWNGATLTAAELAEEYRTYTPKRTTNLRAWYPLTRAELVDYSGQAQTLTAAGAGAATEDGPGISWKQGRRHTHRPLSIPAEATPGLITGTASIPTPGISIGTNVDTSTVLGVASIPTPDIFVGSSPPTNVQPGVVLGVASIPTPTVDTVMNVSITPLTLTGVANIPAPTVSVPINPGDDLDGPGQLSYNGFRIGQAPYTLQLLTGWWVDMPPLDNGDVPNPSSSGSAPGPKYAQSRIVTAELLIEVPEDQAQQAADDFLAGLPVPDGDEQLPIAARVLDNILIGYGACTNRAAPLGNGTRLGKIKASAQFTLAKPELYSRELLTATIPDGGFVEVFNAGNTKTPPLLRCPGPANGPELLIERILPDGSTDLAVLEFDLEVGPTELLIIDVANGTVAIGDVSKLRFRTGASIGVPDFVLGPGPSEISYSTAEGGAPPAIALWRHAHL